MKRSKLSNKIEVVLGTESTKCSKCLHIRKDEPFIKRVYYRSKGCVGFDHTCWRCCRDAESVWMIQQKWPLAFDRFDHDGYCTLEWSPGVKALIGETDEVQNKT